MIKVFLFILFFVSHAYGTEQCSSQGFIKDKKDVLADDWLGLKCDPLDSDSVLQNNGFKDSCDCLTKGEKFSRIKNALFQKNRQGRSDRIQAKLEEKVAEVLRSQIDNEFDQAMRLDTLVKQGSVDLSQPEIQKSFPTSCRASGVGDVIDHAKKLITDSHGKQCSNAVFQKRLKLFLNGKKDFAEYLKAKQDTYAKASMNILTPEDKAKGMCVPYKAFQSLNTQNPLRQTYLKVAKIYGSFSDFQKWATNRTNAGDVFGIVGKDKDDKKLQSASEGLSSLKMGQLKFGNNLPGLTKFIEQTDPTNHIEPIDREAVLHLLKTDPIFERMVKDEDFYSKVIQKDAENFYENDPQIIAAMMASQEKQCKQMYGGLDQQNSQKNLLAQYLCDEDFTKKFLDPDTIRNVLAPSFKESEGIKGIKHTEAIIAKWAYCDGDNVHESNDGSFSMDLSLKSKKNREKSDPQLTGFLNVSLNPKSDLESSDNNEYQKFNKSICQYVKPECKDGSKIHATDFECTTASIANGAVFQIVSQKLGKDAASDFIKTNFFDTKITDKQLRETLGSTGKFENDEINSLIILRNQSLLAKYKRAGEDLRLSLGLDLGTDMDKYMSEHGGKTAVLADPRVPSAVRDRLGGKSLVINQKDNIYEESISDNNASYFTNYYALAGKSDADSVRSSVDKIGTSGDVPASGTIYQRKSFTTTTDSTPGNKRIITNSDQSTKPLITQQAVSLSPDKVEVTKPKTSKELTEVAQSPQAVAQKTEKINLAFTTSGSSSSDESSGSGREGKGDRNLNNQLSDLEKAQRDLEDQLDKKSAEYNGLRNSGDSEQLASLAREKKRLSDQINNMNNGSSSAIGRGASSNYANNFNGGSNNSWNNSSNAIANKSFNNGYARGEEFDAEKAHKKLDDGSPIFDPENASKGRAPASANENNSSDKKGKTAGAGAKLATGGEDGESGTDGAGPGSVGRKKRKGNNNNLESEVALKCGTGAVMKCIFPNSYFIDEKIKSRLYTVIANLKLEGKRFQGLEKIRKSKRDMKMGESNAAKYFLYTYDLVSEAKGHPVSDQEREAIYNEIKTNRNDSTFKKTLIKYRYMTKALPAKTLLSEREALDAINRSITKEEYEALQD